MRFISDIQKYFNYAKYSARSELKAEVANSYLNWIWWILDPICFMLIYTFIFGVVFNGSEPYFPVFIFIGLTAWEFFNKNVTNSVKMVRNNQAIVSKIYIPKFILAISKMLVNGFKMMISFLIVLAMMVVFQVHITPKVIYFIPLMLTLWVLTFGCMCFMLHFGVFVEDLSNVVNIVLRLMFYVTGIFYSVTKRLPAPYGEMFLKCNPLAFILDGLRKVLLYGETPSRKLMLLWFLIGCLISFLGVRVIYKNENSYVKVM